MVQVQLVTVAALNVLALAPQGTQVHVQQVGSAVGIIYTRGDVIFGVFIGIQIAIAGRGEHKQGVLLAHHALYLNHQLLQGRLVIFFLVLQE